MTRTSGVCSGPSGNRAVSQPVSPARSIPGGSFTAASPPYRPDGMLPGSSEARGGSDGARAGTGGPPPVGGGGHPAVRREGLRERLGERDRGGRRRDQGLHVPLLPGEGRPPLRDLPPGAGDADGPAGPAGGRTGYRDRPASRGRPRRPRDHGWAPRRGGRV